MGMDEEGEEEDREEDEDKEEEYIGSCFTFTILLLPTLSFFTTPPCLLLSLPLPVVLFLSNQPGVLSVDDADDMEEEAFVVGLTYVKGSKNGALDEGSGCV